MVKVDNRKIAENNEERNKRRLDQWDPQWAVGSGVWSDKKPIRAAIPATRPTLHKLLNSKLTAFESAFF